MNRLLLAFSLLSISTFSVTEVFSQCTENTEEEVMLMGDSWAFYMNADGTLNNVFAKWGHSDIKFYSNLTLSENGTETWDFLESSRQAEMQTQLEARPNIKAVHLSIGGNDVIGDWHVNFTQQQTDSIRNVVQDRLIQVIDFIHGVRPDVTIVWSGYCYPNFGETIETSLIPSQHIFYGTWEDMGFPTFIQMNTVVIDFFETVQAYTDTTPKVEFINAAAILQYTFGQSDPLGIPPGGTYPPFSIQMPYGDPTYPSPKESMRDYVFNLDSYHLSAQGYFDFIDYQTQKFYHKFLMDDLYILSENNNETGTVSSQGNISQTLKLGENNGEEFAMQLSFNTTGMLDTSLAGASIFLRRESLTGTNPINNNVTVKAVNGRFSASADVEATDYAANGDASANPCTFGSKDNDGDWVRLDLPSDILEIIAVDSSTQFIISNPGFTGGEMIFSDASNEEYAPVLNLDYGVPASIQENYKLNDLVGIYPNPTSGLVYLQLNNQKAIMVDVVNVLGETVFQSNSVNNQINLSNLPSGIYIINVSTEKGVSSKRIVKN